ncbi:MAG: hypothetical protein AAFX05_12795, partial [Planctomycetota bacterium]
RRREAVAPALARIELEAKGTAATIASRALARWGLQQDDFGRRYWTDPVGAHRAMAADRDAFLRGLRRQIAEASRPHRVAGLELAQRLRVLTECAEQVFAATHDSDAHIAATAVRVLSTFPGPSGRAMLLEAVAHADARVRANAVESLGAGGPSFRLAGYAADPVPRIRANAIREMLRARPDAREAKHSLAEMLIDPRPSHRLSALWVAERAGAVEFSDRVADILRTEPDDRVRVRARRCARRLLGEMRRDWADRDARPSLRLQAFNVDTSEPIAG